MLRDKLKSLFTKKEGEDNKKKIENIVVFLVILIITIIVINVIWNDDNDNSEGNIIDSNKRLASTSENIIEQENNYNNLENSLKTILSKISGVGNVEVLITYSETSKIVPVYNEESTQEDTEETDSEGGTRKITQTDTKKEVVYEESDGNKKLITQSTISPRIEGAIITAEGANNSVVKTNIIQAVEAATGLATHKIQVFEMSN